MPSGGCRARSLDLPDQGIPRQRRHEASGQLYRRMGGDARNQRMIRACASAGARRRLGVLQMRTPGSSAGYGRLRPFAGTVVPKLHGAVVEVFLGQAGRDCGRGSRRWALLVTCFTAACFAMAAGSAAACFAMAACLSLQLG